MKKLFVPLLATVVISACSEQASTDTTTTVKSITIPNVGEFIIADTALANQIGTTDTVSESKLNPEQLGQLVPVQFDSAIAPQKIRDYTSYDQIVNELVARKVLKSFSITGDTIIPKALPQKVLLFENVPTASLVETRALVQSLEKAIYNDRSFPIYQVADTAKTNFAKNVLYMVSQGRLPPNMMSRKTTVIPVNTRELSIASLYNICGSSSRWRYDTNIQFSECTAFAISEDLVLTAGHCLDQDNFINFYFMSGFENEPRQSISLDSSNIYKPIAYIDGFSDKQHGIDYALIRVHKKIPKEKIYPCSNETSIRTNDRYYMIGHPMGTHTKISIDGTLLENTNNNYFTLAIDAFGGNSGSPVLNEREHKVKGILISGNADLISADTCSEFIFCGRNARCSGEIVYKISSLLNRPKVKAYLAQHPLTSGQ